MIKTEASPPISTTNTNSTITATTPDKTTATTTTTTATSTTTANLAVLITGGDGDFANIKPGEKMRGLSSAEIWNPQTGYSCFLPNLPEGRFEHSQDGPLLCGDGPYKYPEGHKNDECIKFDIKIGNWTKSHTLPESRSDHASWTPPSGKGTYLIGDWIVNPNTKTSVIVKADGSVEKGFDLKHATR